LLLGETIVVAACLIAGAWAAVRWTPDLAPTGIGRASLVVVWTLATMALIEVGRNLYGLVYGLVTAPLIEIGNTNNTVMPPGFHEDLVKATLPGALFYAGLLLGLATAVHLLAPAPDSGD
jgi:hypothetical protein